MWCLIVIFYSIKLPFISLLTVSLFLVVTIMIIPWFDFLYSKDLSLMGFVYFAMNLFLNFFIMLIIFTVTAVIILMLMI